MWSVCVNPSVRIFEDNWIPGGVNLIFIQLNPPRLVKDLINESSCCVILNLLYGFHFAKNIQSVYITKNGEDILHRTGTKYDKLTKKHAYSFISGDHYITLDFSYRKNLRIL